MESTPALQVQPSEHNAPQPTSRKHRRANVQKYRGRLPVAGGVKTEHINFENVNYINRVVRDIIRLRGKISF